jgi:hypothetical protein
MRRGSGIATFGRTKFSGASRSQEVAVLPLTTAVIGFLLGIGGLRELIVDGIWYRQLQPLLVGAAGALVSSLILLAALAIWLRWTNWPRIATYAGALSIVFHLYAALPPQHNVGIALLAHARRRIRVELAKH